MRHYDHTDVLSGDALEKACEEFGVNYETYTEGDNPLIDARAHEIALDAEITRAEALGEGDR